MRALPAALAAVLLSGCFQVRYTRHVAAEPEPRYDRWHHNFVNGLLTVSGPLRVDEICPQGVAWVDRRHTLLNVVAETLVQSAIGGLVNRGVEPKAGAGGTGAATGGTALAFQVWSPSTIRVACARAERTRAAPEPVVDLPEWKPAEPAPPPAAPPAPPALRRTVAVMRLVARANVDPQLVELFTDLLTAELRRQPGVTVMSDADMGAVLGLEKRKALLGCSDEGCMAELGGALGVDRLVHGSVGRVGESLVVVLSVLDPAKARVTASVSERLRGAGDEAFLDALPGMARQLLAEPPAGP